MSAENLAQYNWKTPDGPCTTSYLLEKVISYVNQKQRREILDIGCGNGFLGRTLGAAGHRVTGIDYDEAGAKIAQLNDPKGTYIQASVYETPPENFQNRFDVVIATEVIEHLFSPGKLINYAATCLKDDGTFIISTPYHGYIKNLIISLTNSWDRHFHPWRDGGHIKFFSPKTLQSLLEMNGFQVNTFRGCGRFPYLWKSMLLTATKPSLSKATV